MLDEHLSWKNPISVVENKVSKKTGILHKAKIFIGWGSTTRTKLDKFTSKQRQDITVMYPAKYTTEKINKMKVLNIYKLNIYQVLTFIYKIKRDTAPATFRNDCREISHRYPSGLSQSNFVEGNIVSNQTNFLSRLEVQSSGTGF